MRQERNGFTTIELLVVIAIIAMLVGILVPTVNYVRKTASEAKQKAQLAAIDMAIMAFKGDYGDYPPSDGWNSTSGYLDYCGAQKLCEALLGWDLLGFHPQSAWRADGYDKDGGDKTYDPAKGRDINNDKIPDTLNERVGPYLELGTANAFTLRQLFGSGTSTPLALDTYVLCDSFGAKSVTITAGISRTVKAGRPILYYKANTNIKNFSGPYANEAQAAANMIYNYTDNFKLIELKKNSENSNDPLYSGTPAGTYLYWPNYKLVDQRILGATGGSTPWPCRPDSYILISAGADGLYGTDDDITNF
jgi:prepilin-type N-terminal cleavage/methylation domain-containing protein